ncbi:MAG: RluA family pseudouridine synthase [Rhodospirillaceae bacterium]|nr:RluA family pseudouridine synthase [Rhodospirillaceae bacterium]
MTGVQQITIGAQESEQRLDRWFKRRFPALTHGRLEKLLRTGQIRVDGGRAKANQRLSTGQVVRVPPLPDSDAVKSKPAKRMGMSEKDEAFVQSLVIYKDDDMIAINKPAGLAVQGGTKTSRHLDGMLDALQFGAAERPRLVHRLDRDTSGVLLLARSAKSASRLAKAFQEAEMHKVYWALVHNRPQYPAGTVDAALMKSGPTGEERMTWDDEGGRDAVTDYMTAGSAADKFTWLVLLPRTGRTHQIRAHCAIMNTPIVGDTKYGAPHMRDEGELKGLGQQLCLHARSLTVPGPGRKSVTIKAPLPQHMKDIFDALEFDERDGDDLGKP